MTTKELMAYAKSKGRVKTRLIDMEKVHASTLKWLASLPPQMTTKRGDFVRPCFDARKSETRAAPPIVRARLGNVFTVEAVTDKAIMIQGQTWIKAWVRCK